MDKALTEAAARAAHEVNRAWCLAHGDASQVSWDDAPEWQKRSALVGVEGVRDGNGPRESHESWLAEKEREGWKYGPTKNAETKEHPCFVPYDQLPPEQTAKDALFVSTVRAVLEAGGEIFVRLISPASEDDEVTALRGAVTELESENRSLRETVRASEEHRSQLAEMAEELAGNQRRGPSCQMCGFKP